MILIRNDDGDQRIMVTDKSCSVKSQELSLVYFRMDACSLIMCLDCTFSCLKCIRLALRILGRGILMTSPVVQDLREYDRSLKDLPPQYSGK